MEIVDASGCRRVIEAENITCAVGRESVLNSELMEDIAREPRKIIDAIHEGFITALDI